MQPFVHRARGHLCTQVYPRYLSEASECRDPLERMKLVVTWFVAGAEQLVMVESLSCVPCHDLHRHKEEHALDSVSLAHEMAAHGANQHKVLAACIGTTACRLAPRL